MKTNWSERVITNLIEVRIPKNVFVDEYRTNWFEQVTTNILEFHKTNWVTKLLTNFVVVELVQTNIVDRYQTNWTTLSLTNWETVLAMKTNWVKQFVTNVVELDRPVTNIVDAYTTNWLTKILTNTVAVERVQTNFVNQYRTNWTTLNLTNWETVLVMRTNWVTQPVTNVVEIALPAAAAAQAGPPVSQTVAGTAPPRPETPLKSPNAPAADTLVLETVRTARPPTKDQVEVHLKIILANDAGAPLHVEQWLLQREDGSVLLLGRDQELKRELPLGKYRIEVKARRDPGSPLLALRGAVEVTRDAVIRHGPEATLNPRR